MSVYDKIRCTCFKIRDYLKYSPGERVCPQWNAIKATLVNYQMGWPKILTDLQSALDYATKNCSYYKKYEGKSLLEFPVQTKIDFIAHGDSVRSPEFADRPTWVSSTSGSTGIPFSVVQNMAKRNRLLAELKYFGERVGYKSHERMVYYRASHGGHKRPFWPQFWSNVWQPDVGALDENNLIKFYEAQRGNNTTAVFGYASSVTALTWEWERRGLKGDDSVKLVLSSAELLTPETRERAHRFWKNAKVISRYANMECGIMGQEYDTPDVYELNWASYYFEILKIGSDQPAADGEIGRIVVTDMFNRAFPMIRYDTGDLGAFERRPGEWPRLVKLSGRRVDMIYATNGDIVSPHAITNTMWGVRNIKQWQFIQDGKKTYRFKYISDCDAATAERNLREKFDQIRESTLGLDAQLSFERLETFPVNASYKHKMFVQGWKT